MTTTNHTRTCDICHTEYQSVVNADGSPRKTKHSVCRASSCRHDLALRNTGRARVRESRNANMLPDGARAKCSIDGCSGLATVSLMCQKHYVRVAKHGSPHETRNGKRVSKPCAWCGESMTLKLAMADLKECCSGSCSSFIKAKRRGLIVHGSRKARDSFYGARRRSLTSGRVEEPIDPLKVFARDKWRCHMCGESTPLSLRGTYDPKAPELDHIVTLADGGSHTWGNVACSCRRCNLQKGARSLGQIGLEFAA